MSALFDAVEQPCHVATEGTHGLQTFCVLQCLFGCVAVDLVPILRTNDKHLADCEIFVKLVKGCACASSAATYYSCGRLKGVDG